jgi:alpha-beta hydrolase superfamily lysophospholipase
MFADVLLMIATLFTPDDYAGWAYAHGGGDFPFRIHVTTSGDATNVTFDSPSERTFAKPAENVQLAADSLTFEHSSGSRSSVRYSLRAAGDGYEGEIVVDAQPFARLELHRSFEPIPAAPARWTEDCPGTYRSDDGHALIVTRWPWGELEVLDLENGDERTLFSRDDDRYFAGVARYVPSPVAFEIAFLRDADDDVIAIERTQNGASTRFARVTSRNQVVSFENEGLALEGTLTLPPGDGPFSAIVICGGSTWTTRATVARRAQTFAALGIASFAYDQRGFGASGSGVVDPDDAPFTLTADDAAAAIGAIAQLREIDSERVGIFGESRGGWVAPLAITRGARAAFAVLFVAPAVSPAQQERSRRLADFAQAGATPAELGLAAKYLDALFHCTDSDSAWDRYAALRHSIADRRIGGGYWIDILWGPAERDSSDYRWQALNMNHDPVPILQNLALPTLVLLGGRDTLVNVTENEAPMRAAFERGGNDDATIVVVPRADHALAPVLDEPLPLHRRVGACPEVWSTVRAWLAARDFTSD